MSLKYEEDCCAPGGRNRVVMILQILQLMDDRGTL